jgi:N-acetylmuramoyl-L-alanine amidase
MLLKKLFKPFLICCVFIALFSGTSGTVETEVPDYVPAAAVIEGLDYDFDFDTSAGTLEIKNDGNRAIFVLDTNKVLINNRARFLKSATTINDGQVLIPSDGIDMIIVHLARSRPSWVYENGLFVLHEAGGMREKHQQNTYGTIARKKYPYDIQVIVIDPGHGGKDPGGIGYNGIEEKDIVLEVAKELKKELQRKYRGKEIIMTREKDVFVSLEERGEIANRIKPEKNPVFISIHANVGFKTDSIGYESYFLSVTPFDEGAREVAQMENSVLNFEIENHNEYIKEIINRIVDIEYRRESAKLAQFIQNRLKSTAGLKSQDRGAKGAFFYVLKAARMPAVLVEIGFVTNKEEALNMQRPDYQKKLAKGIAEGIGDFITTFNRTEAFTK